MFEMKPSRIAGCFELQPKVFEDIRGRFVKVFHEPDFLALGLETRFVEEYYSTSRKNVIRGMHFQTPPMDCVKMVYCVEGRVCDAVLDLRVDSATYGQFELFELDSDKANSIYIPKGMAHGFCALTERATMVYKVSSVYSPQHDGGVLWNSAGIPWPTSEVIMSDRDRMFPALKDFSSPFRHE